MSATAGEGFSATGSMNGVDIGALYARCAELRFSGRLVLRAGERRAEVEFVGGEPMDGDFPGSSWEGGSYTLSQELPDLSGALTGEVALDGSLAVTRPRDLIRHCADLRLTAELYLERDTGESARVRFAHGRVESAEVGGVPELGALTKVERWQNGRFQLTLRPLFGKDAPVPPPTAPPIKEMDSGAHSFDLTGGVPMVSLRPEDVESPSDPSVQPMRPVIARPPPRPPSPSPVARVEERAPDVIEGGEMRAEQTAITRQRPTGSMRAEERPSVAPRAGGGGRKSVVPLAVGAVVLLAAAGGGAWLMLHRSHPEVTKPVPPAEEKAPVAAEETAPEKSTEKAPEKSTEKAPEKSTEKSPEKSTEKAPEKAPEKSPEKATAKAPDETPAPAKTPAKAAPADDGLDPKVADMVARGRRLLVTGHAHSAADWFKKALGRAPRDATIKRLFDMAKGKTGRGEIILEGKGEVTIAGERFRSPKKLKLPAGPWTIETGGERRDVTLGKGKKLRVAAGR